MKKLSAYQLIFLLALLTLLLTACDPTCYPYLVVDQVSILEGKPYLHVAEKVSWGLGCGITTPDRYYVSPDAGVTWKELVTPGEARMVQEAVDSKQITSCVPDDLQVCYRITGEPHIERSRDGGTSWRVDWRMPAGRHLFMIRFPEMNDLVDVEPDLIPYDLAILETSSGYVVLVAYGNQGVLIKSPDGDWKRYAISTATEGVRPAAPIPYRAVDFENAWQTLLSETIWIFLLAFCYLTIYATVSWHCILLKMPRVKPSLKGWLLAAAIPTGIVFVVLVWAFIVSHSNGTPAEWQGLDTMLKYICVLPVVIGSVVLLVSIFSLPNHKAIWLSGLLAFVLALAFFVLTWLPFGLWAWGILRYYWQALIAAAILAGFVLIFGILAESNLVRHSGAGPGRNPKTKGET